MLKQLFTALGRIYNAVISVIVTAVLVVLAWFFWVLYEDERRQSEFVKEGLLVSVPVMEAHPQQKSWRDVLRHSTYLTVSYRTKNYVVRYVMDSVYVGRGDVVTLLYHPDYDALRQPNQSLQFNRSTKKSRLINWSTVSTFSAENILLVICLSLTTASFFFISGLLVTLFHLTFLQDIARIILLITLIVAALFFTYDTWEYFDYYQQLKRNGRQIQVRVLDTGRYSIGNSTRSGGFKLYTYQATIRYGEQERIIPISKDDYEKLKPNDQLQAIHDESMNDCMAADFLPDYGRLCIPLVFVILVFIFLWKGQSQSVRQS